MPRMNEYDMSNENLEQKLMKQYAPVKETTMALKQLENILRSVVNGKKLLRKQTMIKCVNTVAKISSLENVKLST